MDEQENLTALECTTNCHNVEMIRSDVQRLMSNQTLAQNVVPGLFLVILAIR